MRCLPMPGSYAAWEHRGHAKLADATMTSAAVRSGRRHPVLWSIAGGVALLVLLVAICEALGWPFLAGPMQTTLSRMLDRPVHFDKLAGADGVAAGAASAPAGPDRHADGVRIHLLGRIDVAAQRIEIAAPDWSDGPPLLVGEQARLVLRYGDLWRAAHGERVVVRALTADRLAIDLRRKADGRASWQFGEPKPRADEQPMQLPVVERLQVTDGRLGLRDAKFDSDVDARYSLVDSDRSVSAVGQPDRASADAAAASSADAAAADGKRPPDGLRLTATGRYRSLPIKLAARSTGVLVFASGDAASVSVPVRLEASVGYARLSFDGSIRDPQRMAALRGSFSLSGRSLAAVGDVIGVTLPTTAAFDAHGAIAKDGEVWSTQVDAATIGRSRITAKLRYDAGAERRLLEGRVGGPRLVLTDLGPAIGTTPAVDVAEPARKRPTAAPGRVLPDREFDLPSLRAMDANILLDFAEFDLATAKLEPLTPLRAHLVLSDGVLTLRDIDARTASGRVAGELALDARGSAAIWRADLDWRDIRLDQWLKLARKPGSPPYLAGSFQGSAKLHGKGRSTAQILASLDGKLTARIRDGTISHLIVEGAGIDLAQALGVWLKGDDSLAMSCALAQLNVDHGVLRPEALVIDTADSVVWIDGSISLADEALDLRAVTSPKDFSPLSLRTPVLVKGTLSDPAVSLQAKPLAGKAIAAGLLSLLNPLAALLPLIDTGAAPDRSTGCQALAARAEQRRTQASRS